MEFEPNHWVAVGWLSALVGVCLVYLLRQIRKSDYSLWESCLYLPTYLMGRLLWRVHFKNEPPGELQGGALLVANHRSSVDPFFVQLAARRRVHWMVANEYFGHFLFGPILRAVQAIPTNRSGMDTAATKHAMRITKAGRLVGMFPEGRLNHTRLPLVSVRSGAAVIATRSAVPIIPLLIEGSPYRKTVWSPVFIPAHVAITFGRPIYPANPPPSVASESLESAEESERLSDSDALIVEWGRQVLTLAGYPDFPVELASKRRRRLGK